MVEAMTFGHVAKKQSPCLGIRRSTSTLLERFFGGVADGDGRADRADLGRSPKEKKDMLMKGKIWKEGAEWLAESEVLDVMTQGKTRTEAAAMLVDAIESLADERLGITIRDLPDGEVLIESKKSAQLCAMALRRQRLAHGLSIADVAAKLGQSSKTAYARYEQGQVTPSLDKYQELLAAVAPEFGVTISRTRTPSPKRPRS